MKAEIDSLKRKRDSLKIVTEYKQKRIKFDSARQALSQTRDSVLTQLDPNTHVKLLRHQADSLINNLGGSKADTLQQKLQQANNKLQQSTGQVTNALNKSADPFTANGATQPSLNVPNVPQAAIPSLPSVNGSVNAPSLPTTALPDVPEINLDRVKKLDENLQEEVVAGKDKLLEATDLGEVQDQVATVREVEAKAKQIKEGGVDKAAEEAIKQVDEVKELNKQFSEVEKMKQYYDPEVAKAELLNKAKMHAINHFAGHEQELKSVMEKLSAAKAKVPDPEGVIDLFAKRQNTQRDKKWHQRLNYGFDFQLQKPSATWLDVNPYIQYKLSDRFVLGGGWNFRGAYHFEREEWRRKESLQGTRATVEWVAKKGTALKADIESMYGYPRRFVAGQLVEFSTRAWMWSYFAGIKRSFPFGKETMGNVQLLYNLYNPDKRSPYATRVNVRVGFSINTNAPTSR
jgi:hypothetical protein